jgi:DNA sulfur modification protein DndC
MSSLKEKIIKVKKKLEHEFLYDNRPWVITFSGGKDSTTVLQLVIEMLLELKNKSSKKLKPVFIVSSDTGVEMPIIEDYFYQKLSSIKKFVAQSGLNVHVEILRPEIDETFWTLLLGKGYPSPNNTFRWCTDRMKIKPATRFLKDLADKNQSILMLLGVRSDESQARAQSIQKRNSNHRGFTMHNNIPNAFVFAPIKDWSNADVWTYLSQNPPPWGTHSDMMKLYDKGSGEADCNIALNPDAASCGKTRFGCWTCTVVSADKSMENMLRNKEDEWMRPLHNFRNKLEQYRYDHSKRQTRRRNGQKSPGPFYMSVRQELLDELLKIERELKLYLGDKKLISDEEIIKIQEMWLNDGDFFEKAIEIAKKYGRNVPYESVKGFNEEEKKEIEKICQYNKIPIQLIERILQVEHSHRNQLKRSRVFTELDELVESYAIGKINEI